MPRPVFRVLRPGPFTTLQGLPRMGRQRYGVAPGGAMDVVSLRIANALVRNAPDADALEIAMAGPVLEVLTDCTIALGGADFLVTIDGTTLENWRTYRVKSSALLSYGALRQGARGYLAVDGGLIGPTAAPSRLAADVILLADAASTSTASTLRLPASERPRFDRAPTIHIIRGPQWDYFSPDGHDALLAGSFEVTTASDRIGLRLTGSTIAFAPGHAADIVSEATPMGTIQVPASGQPIILMADRPTTGGYAKIATVATTDLPKIAQASPGDHLRFRLVTAAEAQEALIYRERQLRVLELTAGWSR